MLDGNFQARWPQLKRKLDKVAEGFEEVENEVTRTEPPLAQRLTEEAKQLLIAACGSSEQRAVIMYVRTLGGDHIQAGGRGMAVPDDPRSVATWKGALDELEQLGLVEALGYKREVFEVTRRGWEVFDQVNPPQVNP
jgi:hypothetical protein